MSYIRRRSAALAAGLALAATFTACSSDGDGEGGGGDADSITVWIVEDLPDRVAATQAIVDAFSEESGVEVELVAGRRGPVQPDAHLQRRRRGPARRDRRRCRSAQLRTLSANELVDTDAVGESWTTSTPGPSARARWS